MIRLHIEIKSAMAVTLVGGRRPGDACSRGLLDRRYVRKRVSNCKSTINVRITCESWEHVNLLPPPLLLA